MQRTRLIYSKRSTQSVLSKRIVALPTSISANTPSLQGINNKIQTTPTNSSHHGALAKSMQLEACWVRLVNCKGKIFWSKFSWKSKCLSMIYPRWRRRCCSMRPLLIWKAKTLSGVTNKTELFSKRTLISP